MHEDRTVDVLVVGSGAAGLVAALRAADLGLDVIVAEKSDVWGGSLAMSAGLVWMPANRHMRAAGIHDSDEDGVTYLRHLTGGSVPAERIRTFVRDGNRMVDYLEERSRVRLDAVLDYPDYHPEVRGGRPGGRSLEPRPIDGTLLGDHFATLHRPYPSLLMMGRAMVAVAETRALLAPGLRAKLRLLPRVWRYLADARKRRRAGRDPYLTFGQALAGRLGLSLIDRSVPVWLGSPLTSLVREDGRVVGAVLARDGRPFTVRARRGVVVATGGFERNADLRARHQRQPVDVAWTVGNDANTGDGILLAADCGARLDADAMREAWWLPATPAPGLDSPSVFVVEKSLPHGMFVDRRGQRFVNEATSYTDIVLRMYERDALDHVTIPAWFVFDATYRARYNVGPILPRLAMPDRKLRPEWRPGQGWLHRADTIDELAADIGIEPAALRASVERFNGFARRGVDDDFGRGQSANDRYYSDRRSRPNPSLGPIDRPPFYAVPVVPSDLGTKGGLVTDLAGRALDWDDRPIPGLYAAGNAATGVTGNRYPGAGSTIAPAMTLGFLAAEACAADDLVPDHRAPADTPERPHG